MPRTAGKASKLKVKKHPLILRTIKLLVTMARKGSMIDAGEVKKNEERLALRGGQVKTNVLK